MARGCHDICNLNSDKLTNIPINVRWISYNVQWISLTNIKTAINPNLLDLNL